MLEILKSYFSIVLYGRFRSLLSTELLVAVCIGMFVLSLKFSQAEDPGSKSLAESLPQIPVSDFAKLLGTYGALGMGSCLSTLALATRWSSGDFNMFFRESATAGEQWASYSGLLFRLSWAALSHWLALMSGLVISLFSPEDFFLIPSSDSNILIWLLSAFLISLFVYCVMTFLSALLGLSVLCMIRKSFMDGENGVG